MMKKKKKLVAVESGEQPTGLAQWDMFVKVVCAHVDPVLASMLYATQFVQFDASAKVVRVATLKKFVLFQDLFIDQKKVYQEYLDRIFGFQTMLLVEFSTVAEPKPVQTKKVEFKVVNTNKTEHGATQSPKQTVDRTLDVSDTKKWKVTHALLEHFGGSVREIVKDTNEFDA